MAGQVIIRDSHGLPVDITMDGGDSAVRAGMLALFANYFDHIDEYEHKGLTCRHPVQDPWCNEWNQSRDQTIPLVAGLAVAGNREACRRIFWAHAKRGFFSQNTERDWPGTTKYPWPHKMQGGDPKDNGKWRLFDFADPLFPDHIWHLILCARITWLYPFAVIGIPWMIVSMALHGLRAGREHNQIIAMCMIQGPWALRLFKALTPSWEADVRTYWDSRHEGRYADLIVRSLT